MRKKTIAILFIVGIVASALGGGLEAAGASGPTAALVYSGVALAVIGLIFSVISWIGALVATGKQGRWGWFVVVFLLSGLGELIYLIAGPAVG